GKIMNYKNLSDMQRANGTSVIAYGLMNIVLVICYLVEVIKGSRDIPYYIVFCALALIPLIACIIIYKKNQDSPKIPYLMTIGFTIFYLYILFTTTSPVAYTYGFMLAVLLISYNNVRLSSYYVIVVTLGNIIQVAVMGFTGGIVKDNLPDIEIRIGSTVLFSLFLYMSTIVSDKINKHRLEQVETEKEHTKNMMQQILQIADQMSASIQTVTEKMNILEATAEKTKFSMQEVAQGNNETVDSIQMQMEQTEEIQQSIQRVGESSISIIENIRATQQELDDSKHSINDLIKYVSVSNEANESVSKELAELNEYTNQMQSIIDLINNITSQTSLLSLNASIEAARAGEAGKGFAVVASEISNLATQTQNATVDITTLIGNISNELTAVVKVIENMIQNIQSQNEAANNTARNFETIAEKTEQVAASAGQMGQMVKELGSANEVIVKGIETISAVTEEVTAHSTETLNVSEENNAITIEVGQIISNLNQMANRLRSMEQQ
ncbi:MAG: hypothetical protein K2K20_13815, partial [Lachnospiraceae bacterium]|nr:hypothetical protein [Lachnospiraceae bacterium]